MAHYISYDLFDGLARWITVVILELIHAKGPSGRHLLDDRAAGGWRQSVGAWRVMTTERIGARADASFKFLPYQLWMVG